MMKRKRSASGRPRRPSSKSKDEQSEGEEFPSTPDRQRPINSVEDGLAFLREVKEYFKDVDPGKYNAFLNLIEAQYRAGIVPPCVISQVKELFRGHTSILKLYNETLQPGYKILFMEDVTEIQDLAELYVVKVKTRSSDSVYTTFMHILYLERERALTSDEIDQEVEAFFAKSCDLLEEYYFFRPDRAVPVVQSPVHPRHSALEVSELQREQQRERLQIMCEDVAKRKRKEKGKGDVTEQKEEQQQQLKRMSARLANAANAIGNGGSLRSSDEAHPRKPARSASVNPAQKIQGRSRSRSLENAKYNGRSMCTPSYLLLKPPKNGDGDGVGEGEVSVHRCELAKSVLNEECELVPARDSKPGTCNPHEDVLFRCEMDQYICDMLRKQFEATAESFMTYFLKLQGTNSIEMPPAEELLSTVHKRCIQHLYEDDAQEFLEALKENPSKALPVLLNRLVLKLES